jgi:hypothetical protein
MDDLGTMLERWTRQDLLTREQAEQILRSERRDRAPVPPQRAQEPGPVGAAPTARPAAPSRAGGRLVVEALAYLGGVLAVGAALLLVQLVWDDLSTAARLALPLSATCALLLAGQLVPGDADERIRLRSALWLLGTAAWTTTAAVFADQVLEAEPADTLLIVGLAGAALALPLYLHAPRTAAQQLGLFATLAITAGAVGAQAGWDEPTLAGLGVWLVAAGWAMSAELGAVVPRGVARWTAAVALVIGALLMSGSLGGQAAAAVTVVALFTWAVRADNVGLLAIASLGTLQLIPASISYFFPDGGRLVVPVALLAMGGVLVSVAIAISRRRSRREHATPRPEARR